MYVSSKNSSVNVYNNISGRQTPDTQTQATQTHQEPPAHNTKEPVAVVLLDESERGEEPWVMSLVWVE